ncbi:MAG: nucleotidyltransferase family protein [Bacteroidetes bacterium]|nr:nucleotidyltransferase family protein [Bacteroidota bacterium]
MKALILAAGKGERLKGTIDNIPKPMIEYRGKPVLQHNIELCRKYGIREIFINTHHMADVIKSYFGDGSAFGVKIVYSFEIEMLGTAGALNNFRDHLSGEEFFVLYGDNFSGFGLNSLVEEYRKHDCIGIIAFHYREDVSQSGVGEFAADGRILRFVEKPKPGCSDSHWVNAGIYYLSPEILKYIPEGGSDFAKDVIPGLLERGLPLYSVCSDVQLKAFDTPQLLRDAFGEKSDP